jgi:hypothetical protein
VDRRSDGLTGADGAKDSEWQGEAKEELSRVCVVDIAGRCKVEDSDDEP